ncbi:MAG: hypothetical protein ACP5M4_12250 [Acidobacteriaceae bacterium]
MARTQPNLLDLFVALLSGLAGTRAHRNSLVAMTILPSVRSILSATFQGHETSISHLDFSHVSDGLLIRATLETSQYVGSKAIENVQSDLRHRFGAGTKLRINQILVMQGGVTSA